MDSSIKNSYGRWKWRARITGRGIKLIENGSFNKGYDGTIHIRINRMDQIFSQVLKIKN